MICQQCGREADTEAKFCVDCGSPLVLRCPACQTPFEFGSRFCSLCGRSLPDTVLAEQEVLPGQPDSPDSLSELQETKLPLQNEQPVSAVSRSYQCPRCHQNNTHDAEYCFACGMPLEDSQSEKPNATAPESLTPFIRGGFLVRLLAYLVDTVIIALVYLVLMIFYGIYLAATGDDLSDFGEESFLSYLPVFVRLLYETALIAYWSTTPGKRLLGLYVIRVDTLYFGLEGLNPPHGPPVRTEIRGVVSRIGLGRALTRHLATYISALILGIGYLQVAFREDKLSLHDQISKTMVVKRDGRSPK